MSLRSTPLSALDSIELNSLGRNQKVCDLSTKADFPTYRKK